MLAGAVEKGAQVSSPGGGSSGEAGPRLAAELLGAEEAENNMCCNTQGDKRVWGNKSGSQSRAYKEINGTDIRPKEQTPERQEQFFSSSFSPVAKDFFPPFNTILIVFK